MLSDEVTLDILFHYVNNHFEAHAAEIESLIAVQAVVSWKAGNYMAEQQQGCFP